MTSLLPASKFTFDPQNSKWVRERVRVQIAKHPFAQGGMRVVYRMREFDERINNGEYIECVAKKFKPDCEEKQYYYDEAMTQMVCESYAQEFNRRGTGYYLGFLPVSVLRLDCEGILYNTEPYLRGDYLKHNDNSGHVDTKDLVPQAFSHFTYEASNQTLIVVDIQGVGDYYTDPQIHSFNGDGFGLGNLGQSGIRKFLSTHQCNRICRMLSLTDPKQAKKKPETDEEMARRLQEDELRNAPEFKQRTQWTSQRYTQELGHLEKMVNKVMNKRAKQEEAEMERLRAQERQYHAKQQQQQQQQHFQRQQAQQQYGKQYAQPRPQMGQQYSSPQPRAQPPRAQLRQQFSSPQPHAGSAQTHAQYGGVQQQCAAPLAGSPQWQSNQQQYQQQNRGMAQQQQYPPKQRPVNF